MKSYPSWEQVRAALGDKVIDALREAVSTTREDLTDYRRLRPAWVAAHTERGLAAWIHDRFWFQLVALVEELPGVSLVDHEPTREIWVGPNHRLRVKRHHEDGHVSTYPTLTALDFLGNEQLNFDGFEEVHLIAGYTWEREARDLGPAVISLRNGSAIIWKEELEPPAANAGSADVIRPITPQPVPPMIELAADDDKESNIGDSGSE